MSSIRIKSAVEMYGEQDEATLLRTLASVHKCDRIYKYAAIKSKPVHFTDYKLIRRPADEKGLFASTAVYKPTLVYDKGKVIGAGGKLPYAVPAGRPDHSFASSSQYAADLMCLYCRKKNVAERWPSRGDVTPYYCQKEPGEHHVSVSCGECGKKWYVVWDDDPGCGCDPPTPAATEADPSASQPGGPVAVTCPACGMSGKVPSEFLGRHVRCRKCAHRFRVGGEDPGADSAVEFGDPYRLDHKESPDDRDFAWIERQVMGFAPAQLNRWLQGGEPGLRQGIKIAEEAIGLCPDLWIPYCWAAIFYQRGGRLAEARLALVRGIRRCKQRTRLYEQMAQLALQERDVAQVLGWSIKAFVSSAEGGAEVGNAPMLSIAAIAECHGEPGLAQLVLAPLSTRFNPEAISNLRDLYSSLGTEQRILVGRFLAPFAARYAARREERRQADESALDRAGFPRERIPVCWHCKNPMVFRSRSGNDFIFRCGQCDSIPECVSLGESDDASIETEQRGGFFGWLWGGRKKRSEVQDLLAPFASRAGGAAVAMTRAAEVGARARTPQQALNALAEMARILESGGPDCAETAQNIRMLLAVEDESAALDHCRKLAETLARTAKQMNDLGGLLGSL